MLEKAILVIWWPFLLWRRGAIQVKSRSSEIAVQDNGDEIRIDQHVKHIACSISKQVFCRGVPNICATSKLKRQGVNNHKIGMTF